MQRFRASSDKQLLYTGVKVLVFAILCSGFIVGLVSAYGGSDDIYFPGPVSSRKFGNQPVADSDDSDTPVSLDLASRLNSIDTSDEFLQLLQNVPENEKRPMLTSRFGEGEARSNALMATPARCIPELQPVSLKLDDDPSTIIFPSCTRIKRCGGCCSSSLLSCQPTATETRNFEVIVASVGLNYKGRQIVPLEEHTKCKCDCRIKEEDCNDKQHYESHNCKCVCNNVDEADKCRRNNDTKIWNTDLCVCSCRTIEPCNTGYYFDHNTCRCRQISLSRTVNRFASTKGSNYNFANTQRPENVPPVIISLDASDPRRKPKEDPEYK